MINLSKDSALKILHRLWILWSQAHLLVDNCNLEECKKELQELIKELEDKIGAVL